MGDKGGFKRKKKGPPPTQKGGAPPNRGIETKLGGGPLGAELARSAAAVVDLQLQLVTRKSAGVAGCHGVAAHLHRRLERNVVSVHRTFADRRFHGIAIAA